MGELITRRLGFPILGYRPSVARHLVGPNYISGPYVNSSTSSEGFFISPLEGKLVRRGGCASLGNVNGILEVPYDEAVVRGRWISEMVSPSSSDGFPVPLTLFTDEARRRLWLYWIDAETTDMNLGKTFSATHYPTGGGVTINARHTPMPYYDGYGCGMSRLSYEAVRRYFGQGSRSFVQMGSEVFLPGFYGLPARWGRTYNINSGSGTNVERARHTGLAPPLRIGSTTTGMTSGATVRPWKAGQQVYYSVAYEDENGEVSMPFVPGGTTTPAAPAGEFINCFGLATVPSTSAYWDFLRIKIPICPYPCRRRFVLRSTQVDPTTGITPNPLKLFVTAVIDNNTQTTYDDPFGNDEALVDDPDIVRLDRKWPYPARYNGTFDHRHVSMWLKPPNPCALLVGPTGVAASMDYNYPDSQPFSNVPFAIRIVSGQLQLKYGTGGGVVQQNIVLNASTTLRNVLETIQATTFGSTAHEWGAQLVPGADAAATVDNLALTYIEVTNCSAGAASTTLATTSSFQTSEIAIGMRVRGHANIPAGTYVKSIESATSLTLSAATTGAVPAATTINFTVDTGDDAVVNDGTNGNIRVFCAAWPLALPWKKSFLDAFNDLPLDLEFTAGGPSDPPDAGNSFVIGNRRHAPIEVGRAMGTGSLLDGAVTLYTNGIGRLRNIKGGKSGEDNDYRNEIWSWYRGCISPYGTVQGNGWVGYFSPIGYVITDGQNDRVITRDLYDPGTGQGDLAYEIGRSLAAAKGNTDDFGFYARIENGRLFINFRMAPRVSDGEDLNVTLCYDFSTSVDGTGLTQALRPDGTPYGWSTPLLYNPYRKGGGPAGDTTLNGPIGFVHTASGPALLQTDNSQKAGVKTYAGMIAQLETGYGDHDEAEDVAARAWTVFDLCDTLMKKAGRQLRHFYKDVDGVSYLVYYRTKDRTGGAMRPLEATVNLDFDVAHIPLTSPSRSLADGFELLIVSDGRNMNKPEHWGTEHDAEVLPTYRSQGG